MAGAKSFRELKVYGEYLSPQDFDELDGRYQAIGGMLSRMIDRADDFCKHAPMIDYPTVISRVEAESPFTDHYSRMNKDNI